MSCASLWAGAPFALACATPRVDSAGEPACELCGRRLRTVKHQHKHGPGHACHPRCKERKRPTEATAAQSDAAATHQPKKQRAASDPGEQTKQQLPRTQSITRRVLPPNPTEQALPRSMRSTEKIARQLEETHARRVAAMAAAASSAAPFPLKSDTAVGLVSCRSVTRTTPRVARHAEERWHRQARPLSQLH